MLRKAKRLPVIVMLVLIAVFLGSLSGCGDSADPLGTGIIQFYDASTGVIITSVTVQPGSSVTLVVRVMILRSDGTLAPVIGERVAFTLMTPGNGGGLTVVNERTAGNGQAMAVYTAGNNSSTDNVRATTSNGATASITITKIGGPVGARISTLAASPTTVAPYQTSIITATVTDGNTPPNPIMGEPVTFTLAQNESDACFINTAFANVTTVTVNTDASGRAIVLFRGGGYDPYSAVSDIVRATLANGSTNLVSITRSAGTPLSISVSASPSVVTDGRASIITATLTGDGKVGVLVNFSLPVNNSGARLSASSAVTDGSGNAVVTYTSGSNNLEWDVSDSVQASVGSISASAAITRSGAGGTPPTPPTTPLSIAVAASSTSVSAGQVSIITATLTGENNAGVTVTFSLTVNNSGASLSASSAVTDGGGRAVVTYTAGANSPTLNVSDVVKANVSTISSSAAITRTGTGTPIPISIAVAASPTSVNAGQVSVITATLTGASISGVTVNFTLPVNNSGATLSAASAVTDGGGRAVVIYQPGTTNPTVTVQDTVQAAVGTATSTVAITRVGSATTGFSITIAANPDTLTIIGGNSVITANVKNNQGTVVTGVTVTFTSSAGSLNGVVGGPVTAITDGSGNAQAVFTGPTVGGGSGAGATNVVTATITISGNIYNASVVITNP